MKIVRKVLAFPFVLLLVLGMAAAYGLFKAAAFVVEETISLMDEIARM